MRRLIEPLFVIAGCATLCLPHPGMAQVYTILAAGGAVGCAVLVGRRSTDLR